MAARQATYTFTPQERLKTRRKKASATLSYFQYLSLILFGALLILVLVGGVILYKDYRFYLKLRHEIAALSQQNAFLGQEYQSLTAKEVVLKRARALGLRPPKKDQIVELELR